MELIVRKKDNGWEIVYVADEDTGGDGESYELNNTDEVLGRAVMLIIDWFKSPIDLPTPD